MDIQATRRGALADRIGAALERNPYLMGRMFRFETDQGRVILRGVVDTYFQKQMAQEALRDIDGVEEIENELEVV
ncbi:MAG: BON domain-containing protein [Planctomycetota bacterium]|nr:MAG: BON domain-containing protein [Planctomycetota bacterium]